MARRRSSGARAGSVRRASRAERARAARPEAEAARWRARAAWADWKAGSWVSQWWRVERWTPAAEAATVRGRPAASSARASRWRGESCAAIVRNKAKFDGGVGKCRVGVATGRGLLSTRRVHPGQAIFVDPSPCGVIKPRGYGDEMVVTGVGGGAGLEQAWRGRVGGDGVVSKWRVGLRAVSGQRSAVSDQLSAISCQRSAFSYQLSGVSGRVWGAEGGRRGRCRVDSGRGGAEAR